MPEAQLGAVHATAAGYRSCDELGAFIELNEVCEEEQVPDQDAAWDVYHFLKGEGLIEMRIRQVEESIKEPASEDRGSYRPICGPRILDSPKVPC